MPPARGRRLPPGERAAARQRRRVRRRRATLLGAGLAVLAAGIVVAVLAGGSSHAHAHARANLSAGAARADNAATNGARDRTGASASATRDGESPEIRRLIALGKPIYCAGSRGDEVALTFDDGPGPYTRLMLAKLHKHGVHATFFVVGRNIPLLPDAPREERAIGAVGDHTFTHPLLTAIAPGEAEDQIVKTQRALERSSAGRVFLFRPPYGGHNATVDSIVRSHGLLEILWTVDSADSLGASYAQIERTVTAGLRPGAIILMHENHGQTIRAMIAIFAALQRRHLRAVSVPQLLTDDPPSAAQLSGAGGGCGVKAGTGLSGG
ncbi:MAG TPA: polysaccharide deacetylase family protein [Solirubrobacteraceae bacterium]|jgi:peptidoglycan/xylan/chitin deacetylase (PgdA/CDA1 family)